MPIFDVTPDDVQALTFITNPARTFTTSSLGAVGSVFVVARRSSTEKDAMPVPAFIDSAHDDSDAAAGLKAFQEAGFKARQDGVSFLQQAETYLDSVRAQGTSVKNTAVIGVRRLVPSTSLGRTMVAKQLVKDVLSPWHRPSCPSAHWAYSNYHSLNFFTASTVDSSAGLLYPNVTGGEEHTGHVTGVYALSGAFSFDFCVNPRYRPDQVGGVFRAGTVFHLSSSYALSLVSGSARDHNGRVTGYRLQLQLSHSADITPSAAMHGPYPHDLVFLSDDNSLSFNTWHHVVVRWGTQYVNDGTGSFNIDGVDRGTFVVPSGTIMPSMFTTKEDPAVLTVGNFLEGSNSGSQAIASMFGPITADRFGIAQLWNTDGSPDVVATHPLNAELHDLSIRRSYTANDAIAVSGSSAPPDLGDCAFYAPPFFRQSSPLRRSVSGSGGVPLSPYQTYVGSTEDPMNVMMSFGTDGHLINVENFLTDLANDVDPYAHGIAFAPLSTPVDTAPPVNEALYNSTAACRGNLMVLPCDDGNWVPNFDLIGACLTGSRHATLPSHPDASTVCLDGLLSTGSLLFGSTVDDATDSQDALVTTLLGITPDSPAASPGPALTSRFASIAAAISSGTYTPTMHRDMPTFVFQRTRDPSSNSVVMFDVSNIFYGTRILPGSLVLSEPWMTGSAGAVPMTLRDDGQGGLYRADSLGKPATWSSVGTVFYNEGLVVLKSPQLALFGSDGFTVSFKGERPVHVMRIDAVAPANQLNSSSNPTFQSLRPSGNPNDPDDGFVYLTGVNFHDENMNIVMRTQLAQPVTKRHGDRIMIRVRCDF